MNKFFKAICDFFKEEPYPNNTPLKPKLPIRRYVKDVKPGELVQVEWRSMYPNVGFLKCLNNDPITKKILFEVRWNNYKKHNYPEVEKVIFDYDGEQLKNFHLLNAYKEQKQNSQGEGNDYDISTLQKQMNDALSKEDYETADKLQKKIDKLLKK